MSHFDELRKGNGKDPTDGDLPRRHENADDEAPLSPLGTEGCQWDESYPHLEDDEDSEEG